MFTKENLKRNYKWWIAIVAGFIFVRVGVFASFWRASLNKGGWSNFYIQAQPAQSVLMGLFHDYCDWHPPLYYFFTSVFLKIFGSPWAIYSAQIVLVAVSLVFVYKITHLFFSEKIALFTVLLAAVEPYLAWHNWLLVSENLGTLLFLSGIYYFLKAAKGDLQTETESFFKKYFFVWGLSGFFLGLATLTRPNTLLLPAGLSALILIIWLVKNKIGLTNFLPVNGKKIITGLVIFNIIFIVVLLPWIIRNKIVYNRFSLANMTATNIYWYNLPPLISMQKNISYAEAFGIIQAKVEKVIGKSVADQDDCKRFSKDEFSRLLDYLQKEAKQKIFADFSPYLKLHLFKAIPFFFQPGYYEMWSAYDGNYNKPDITALILKGEFGDIKSFLSGFDAKLIAYLLGIIFWGISSLAIFIGLLYSYFKDKEKFLFFLISAAVVLYSALLISPFVLARYRLPLYVFFFPPLAYIIGKIFDMTKNYMQKRNNNKNNENNEKNKK